MGKHEDDAEVPATGIDPRSIAWESPGADLAIGALVPQHVWLDHPYKIISSGQS
ncbi:hypothetical protein AB0B89_23085 [Sphaerisporangium sp. NPDC049002]|uniref:hypothetical protein n=1 Tax=unclassified Sphaerisporangium TaxID=2630420 RepID=UPI003409453F